MRKKTEESAEPPPDPNTEGAGAFWRFVLPLSLLLIGASIGFALTALGISHRLSSPEPVAAVASSAGVSFRLI